MNQDIYLLTHFIRDTPGKNLKHLGFIVYKDQRYFNNFSHYELSLQKIEAMEHDGAIQKLAVALPIHKDHAVFITPGGVILLAEESNPFADLKKIQIAKISEPEVVTEDNILTKLNLLWNPFSSKNSEFNKVSAETLVFLKKCIEWEIVLACLKIQVCSRAAEEIKNHSWIYELLFAYQNDYGKNFHAYCSHLRMKFDYEKFQLLIGDKPFKLEVKESEEIIFLVMQTFNRLN